MCNLVNNKNIVLRLVRNEVMPESGIEAGRVGESKAT